LESFHESKDLLLENDSLCIADKGVPSKTISNDLTLQNCFDSLPGLENVVVGTNYTTQVELALEKKVVSHCLTTVPVDVALVPDVAAHKLTLLTIVTNADVAMESNLFRCCFLPKRT